MALSEGQVQVRDLVMGEGTQFIVSAFNPYNRSVRADRTGDAPWGDGGWSGSEWREVAVVNMGVHIDASSNAEWQALHWQLDAAFAPIRTGASEIELRWMNAGTEYLMFGRPRMLQPTIRNLRSGQVTASASFVCPDPAIYSGIEHTATVGVLRRTGGLSTPFSVPFGVSSVVADGVATLANAGTSPARLLLRIVGPVSAPRVTVIGPGGIPLTLFLTTVLGVGEFLDIDTAERLVLLNGTTSRLSDAFGDWPLLAPGVSTIEFRADAVTAGTLTIRFRDTY